MQFLLFLLFLTPLVAILSIATVTSIVARLADSQDFKDFAAVLNDVSGSLVLLMLLWPVLALIAIVLRFQVLMASRPWVFTPEDLSDYADSDRRTRIRTFWFETAKSETVFSMIVTNSLLDRLPALFQVLTGQLSLKRALRSRETVRANNREERVSNLCYVTALMGATWALVLHPGPTVLFDVPYTWPFGLRSPFTWILMVVPLFWASFLLNYISKLALRRSFDRVPSKAALIVTASCALVFLLLGSLMTTVQP